MNVVREVASVIAPLEVVGASSRSGHSGQLTSVMVLAEPMLFAGTGSI
jgi:hypothetical protein